MIKAMMLTGAVENIRLLERRRIDATKTNDVATLSDLIDDDIVYVGKAGAIYNKTVYPAAISTRELIYE